MPTNNLTPNIHQTNWVSRTKELFENQIEDWALPAENYKKLAAAETRKIALDEYEIKIQFNPARIISTSADVSKSAVEERKCFLCKKNRPVEQFDLLYRNDFVILVNPYPILPEHFTIASLAHSPQNIENHLDTFLNISRDLGECYSIYYNGPGCGASAPDHMHFQAGTKNYLPVEQNYEQIKKQFAVSLIGENDLNLFAFQTGFRNFISVESPSPKAIVKIFNKILNSLRKVLNTKEEPMINIISSYEKEMWRIVVFLRQTHRPKQFYSEGEEKLLISPAVIDLGGILITPRQEDFIKLTDHDIKDIIQQVTINEIDFSIFLQTLKTF